MLPAGTVADSSPRNAHSVSVATAGTDDPIARTLECPDVLPVHAMTFAATPARSATP